ncbi:hypothetical protein SAMN05421743_112117 [Thalassobacillus cyri]|uniref:Uncharacterized protein n=1 Tax=Thalassobacillus cyri TaxID=571932 RepID=A0A1H4FUC2_9BACI|nr:hypothetical protein [Thalassobacillus cyri]SEB00430.1 hypothetical protein SAMN05421743_112117 [Thalassobacillus cyri]
MHSSMILLIVTLSLVTFMVIFQLRKFETESHHHAVSTAVIMVIILYVSSLSSLFLTSLVVVLVIGGVVAGLLSLAFGFQDTLQWPAIVHGLMAALMGWMVMMMLGTEEKVQYLEILSLISFILMTGWLFISLAKDSESYNKLFLFCFVVLVFHEFLRKVVWPV